MTRIIQITASSEGDNTFGCLYALTDEGKVYELVLDRTPAAERVWAELPPIPEPHFTTRRPPPHHAR